MVSMKEISKKCGVSVATVSKALNGHSDIGERTREQIKRVAKEMGYFPNSAARALKTNRTYNIGVLFTDEAHSGLTHDYFAQVLDSLKVMAESEGYDITFISRNPKRSMSYLEHSRSRGVDGVIIACVNFYDSEVLELVQSEIPIVTIDYTFNNRTAVISDNVKGMHDLLQEIVKMGHKKIAYIHGADSAVTQNRVGSFYKTMDELGILIPDGYVREGVYHDPDVSAQRTKELLKLKNRPTCIIYPDDFSCLGGINVIKENGLKIPSDISIAGYDGIRLSQFLEPKLTTLKQDTKKIGSMAAKKLIEIIERPKSSVIERVIIEGTVIKGGSVAETF